MVISIIIFIFTILVLVVIHELGHFLMAKRFGIKVEEFGFGIPPRIFGKRIGETLYSLNALPLGGFVRLLGEDEVDKKVLENPRSFAAQSVWKRILVVIAGVVMNLTLAWVLFYTVIISQNFRIIYPTLKPVVFVSQVQKDFPAEVAGVRVGEKLLAIDDQPVKDIDQARNLIRSKEGVSIKLTLSDVDEKYQRTVALTPKKVEGENVLIGVVFSPLAFKQYLTPSERVFSGISYSWDLTHLTFIGFGQLLNDLIYGNFEKASQSVSGPVGIAGITTNILSLGAEAVLPYLWFVGVISLTLTIFNVLPIPALDGGRLFFLVIEAFFKKKVRVEVERMIHQVGFVLLLILAFLITYSDISKMVK